MNTVVCVAGMHRSGTSMTTRMLNLCGLYLGEEQDLMPPHPDNPEGYWENQKFVEINNAVLSFYGGSWHVPPDPDSILNTKQGLSFLEEQARNLIDSFAGKVFWGWKDPRNSITLPFWRRLLPELKVIICLRNPVEVVQSMARRDHFSEIFGFNLWQTYNQRLMMSVTPAHRLITHYNIYFADPETELHRLLEFMNIKVHKSTVRSACQTTLSSLKRNRATFGNLIETGAPLDVVNLYAEMCSQAGQPYLSTMNKIDIQQFPQNIEYFDREIELDLLSRFIEKDPLTRSMTQWVARKQRQIELLIEQLKEKELSLTTQLAEKEHQLVEKEYQLAEKEHMVQILSAQVTEKEQQLNQILISKAWRFSMFLRRIRIQLFPPNSLRERMAQVVKNLILHPRNASAHYFSRAREISEQRINLRKVILTQNKMISKTYSKHTKKLILFSVPGYDIVNGGIMSIASLVKVSAELVSEHGAEVIACTLPGHSLLNTYSKFENSLDIFRFDQIPSSFIDLDELIIHIPECYILDFLMGLRPKQKEFLKNIPNLQINVLIQNIWLMPSKDVIDSLREFTENITGTTAHEKYCTQELKQKYDIHLHHFSVSFLTNYYYKQYEEKEDLLIISNDRNDYRESVLNKILTENKKIRSFLINNVHYEEYKRLLSRAKWVITFGEGQDGYFIEGIRSGAIPFAVYNADFFSDRFKNLPNIYNSYEEMLQRLSEDMLKMDNPADFSALSNLLMEKDKLEYDETKYRENVRDFYAKRYTLP